MTLWRVSINGEDWVEVEAPNAGDAVVEVLSDDFVTRRERREIELLIVRKAERTAVSLRDPGRVDE